MSFISKILDTFKMESTREMKNGSETESKSERLYKDRFHYEYRKPNMYKEISFSGKNFDSPDVQICTALLLDQSKKGCMINN